MRRSWLSLVAVIEYGGFRAEIGGYAQAIIAHRNGTPEPFEEMLLRSIIGA